MMSKITVRLFVLCAGLSDLCPARLGCALRNLIEQVIFLKAIPNHEIKMQTKMVFSSRPIKS